MSCVVNKLIDKVMNIGAIDNKFENILRYAMLTCNIFCILIKRQNNILNKLKNAVCSITFVMFNRLLINIQVSYNKVFITTKLNSVCLFCLVSWDSTRKSVDLLKHAPNIVLFGALYRSWIVPLF